eukprot:gene13782-13900_t
MTELILRLREIVGAAHVLCGLDMAGYLVEPRHKFLGRAVAVVRPRHLAEVAAILRLCSETGTPVVPQGGNTGLVGGQITSDAGALVLSLQRMNQLRELDTTSNSMVVEAGMTLAQAQAEAERADRLFPLSLASQGSCTIGGNLATNAGGTGVIAYGMMRDLVLGLEVVLADGRVLNGLSKLKKDNTGYDLKHLFMGAEGTLGVITAASLKLFPRPRHVSVAFLGLASPAQALALLNLTRPLVGGQMTAFELIPRIGIEFVAKHAGQRDPLAARHDWYVLLELSAQTEDSPTDLMETVLAAACEAGCIADAALAQSAQQAADFWALRELMSEMQGREGGSIKNDVSVPVARVADFIETVSRRIHAVMPGARMVPFGHVGDGNIHCNISQPVDMDKEAFLARWDEITNLVNDVVLEMHGSISAEHGIGQMKRELLARVKDPVALELMRTIKAALDPQGIMNPGKVI